jgi:uncharacterized repeat protein (TIGR01451 family)
MATTDGSGQSQYQTMSTWTTTTVNSQGPSAVSVSPNPGVPAMTQAFTYTARSVNGWDYIANTYMKLSPTPASDQACIVYLSRWEGVWLNDDAGNIFANHARLGEPGAVLHNSRCTLDAEHSSWSYSGTDLSMTLQFTFDPSFVGAKTQYMYVTDRGNNVTDWQPVGTFTVGQPVDPDLTITKTHSGNFVQGQTAAAYTITVRNAGTGSTTGTITVTDTVPFGLTATAISGTGWACTQPAGPCTRSDALAPGSSYSPITLTVNVASNAPATLTNTATVSGGGESDTANDSAVVDH